eukprot:5249595-Amphidinium_carterae.1
MIYVLAWCVLGFEHAQGVRWECDAAIVPSRLYITKDDVRRSGVMLGCGGCQRVMLRQSAQGL